MTAPRECPICDTILTLSGYCSHCVGFPELADDETDDGDDGGEPDVIATGPYDECGERTVTRRDLKEAFGDQW